MEAPQVVPDPPDRNAAVAEASERQHQVNLERELEYLGLRKRVGSGLAYYATEDIYDFVRRLVESADRESAIQPRLDHDDPAN